MLTAALGAAVLVLESVPRLNQWQINWVLHRSTVEALKHENFLYLDGGPVGWFQWFVGARGATGGPRSQKHDNWTHVTTARTANGASRKLAAACGSCGD